MIKSNTIKIITLLGMAGSGKSTATNFLKKHQIPSLYFGGILLEKMKDLNVDITPENEIKYTNLFRKKEGENFIVNEIIKQAKNLIDSGQKTIVIDGLYSWSEFLKLKKVFSSELITIALLAPQKTRYRRLRDRTIRPFNHKQAIERDYSEIENLNKGGPIALADHYIVSNNKPEYLIEDLVKCLKEEGIAID